MNTRRKILISLIIALATFQGFGAYAHAAGEATDQAEVKQCDFTATVNAIAEARKKSDGSLNSVTDELAARKDALRQIISCAQDEVLSLQNTVKGLEINDADVALVQNRMLDGLSQAISFYSAQDKAVNDLGLKGSKDMARTIIDWRTHVYAPLAGTAGNLVLWNKNQPLFDAAQKRFDQISQMVNSLKLLDDDDVSASYKEAGDKLRVAQAANMEARKGLIDGDANDVVSANIQSSLETLADTYKAFFSLSESVKKIIPM